ncbi:MAG: polysaccharide deacetylase family protein [Ktedonobacteraceae bacterium]
MRKQVGIILAAFFYYSGLIRLARKRFQRNSQSLIILNYHRATGGDLRRHLLYLRRHYRIMHLEEALEELYNTDSEHKIKQDKRTKLTLTFDDGYYDNYTHAYKLASELHIPITIFLIPGYIESGKPFWWLEGNRLAKLTQIEKVKIQEYVFQLERDGDREKLAQTIDSHLRAAQSVAKREEFLSQLYKALMIPVDTKVEDEARPLSWEEVKQMEESGWVSFGAHTMHHPILANLTESEEVKYEVNECCRVLEQHLQHPIRSFAYPIGRLEHIGEETVQAVREAGYRWAVTTVSGVSALHSNPYLLERLLGDVSRNWLVMAAEVSGIWKLFSPLWKNSIFGFGDR